MSCDLPKLINNPFGTNLQSPGFTEPAIQAPIPTLIVAYPPRVDEAKLENAPRPIQTVIESKALTIEHPQIESVLQSLFVNPGFGINFFTVETDMLPAQWVKYQTEINAEKNFDQNTDQSINIRTDPSINFLYPSNLYNPFPIDAVSVNGGWVTKETLAELGAYSPKFNFILTFIQQRADKRHFINSSFLERFGVDLLAALLMVAGFVPLVATFAHRDSGGRLLGNKSLQHAEIITAFNTNRSYNILISNMVGLDVDLVDVDYVHFVENIKYEKSIKLLNRIYKNRNYSVRKPLKVIYYISNGPKGERSSDYQNLEKFVSKLNEAIQTGIRLQ